MEEGYSFTVDKEARVISWGEKICHIAGKESSMALGKPYHEVFPRLLSDSEDAVSLALSGSGKIVLKGYTLKCPHEGVTADIGLEPSKDIRDSRGRKIRGVKVTVSNIVCPVLQGIRNMQRFLDIGRTASSLAHGVRNPLNAMKGAVLYLSEKYGNERTLVEFAAIMDDEIKKFDNFISKFLSASLTDVEMSLTDVNSMMKKIQVLTSYQTHFYRIRTVYEYGDIPPVMANSFHLEHAILNIINNAIEVMHGGGRLSVKTRLESISGGHYIVVEVSDTGSGLSGMSAAQYTKDRPPEERGKGFGLLITREILRCYGGHLEIDSNKGRGTTASIYIACKINGGNER